MSTKTLKKIEKDDNSSKTTKVTDVAESKLESYTNSELLFKNNKNKNPESTKKTKFKNFINGVILGAILSSPAVIFLSYSNYNRVLRDLPKPTYDQREGVVFNCGKFNSLQVDVKAVAQTNNQIYRTSYLLNGITNTGAWYQVGLDYIPSKDNKNLFNLSIDIFSKKGLSEWNGGKDKVNLTLNFSKPVKENDTVQLSLICEGSKIILSGKDLDNGGSASYSYLLKNSNEHFIGTVKNGAFTGIMTEIYHYGSSPQITEVPVLYKYLGQITSISFIETGFANYSKTSEYMWNSSTDSYELGLTPNSVMFKPIFGADKSSGTEEHFRGTSEIITFGKEETVIGE